MKSPGRFTRTPLSSHQAGCQTSLLACKLFYRTNYAGILRCTLTSLHHSAAFCIMIIRSVSVQALAHALVEQAEAFADQACAELFPFHIWISFKLTKWQCRSQLVDASDTISCTTAIFNTKYFLLWGWTLGMRVQHSLEFRFELFDSAWLHQQGTQTMFLLNCSLFYMFLI